MSRVRVFTNLKGTEKEWPQNNAVQNAVIKMLLFDIWILRRSRATVKTIGTVLYKMYAMGIPIGLVFIFMLAHAKLNSLLYNNECSTKSVGNIHNILRIADHSQLDERSLIDEVSKLKRAAFNLELELHKMSTLYGNLRHVELLNNLPDYASETAGGSVIATPDTETFYEPDRNQLSIFGIPIWKPSYFSPRKVIQPWSEAGECWAFRGSHGKIIIELAYTVIITHVTMEHIPRSISLTGVLDSAPKEFIIHGTYKEKHILTDTFVYNINGLPSQTFEIKSEKFEHIPLKRITVEVLSNWGNSHYTCIYRFRVHGKMSHDIEEFEVLH